MGKVRSRSNVITASVRRALVVTALVGLALSNPASATDVNLDLSPLNGDESLVTTTTLQSTPPIKISNKVSNNAAEGFRFVWPGAGPGGFNDSVNPGPGAASEWVWQTWTSFQPFIGPIEFTPDLQLPIFGLPPGGIQSSGQERTFNVLGRNLFGNDPAPLSSATLTSSQIAFFSPPVTITEFVSQVQLGVYRQTVTNNSGETVAVMVDEINCCPVGDQTICGETCIDYLNDEQNCGGCGVQCQEFEEVTSCDFGCCFPTQNCNGTCSDFQEDPLNCGQCGAACDFSTCYTGTGSCSAGVCECDDPGLVLFASLGGYNAGADDGGAVVTIDEQTGAATVLGTPIFGAGLPGLAFDSTGRLFATTSVLCTGGGEFEGCLEYGPRLIEIDPNTGALIDDIGVLVWYGGKGPGELGGPGFTTVTDLSFQPGTDILFGTTGYDGPGWNSLVTIDINTAEVTLVDDCEGTFFEDETVYAEGFVSIAFASDGTLYGKDNNGFTLWELDPSDCSALSVQTVVPNIGGLGLGVRPSDGQLVTSDWRDGIAFGNDIYTIDPSTANATLVGPAGGTRRVHDFAFGPPPTGGEGGGGEGLGDCCETTVGVPGCSDPVCQDAVCELDSFCCDTEWDNLCVEGAETNEACDCQGGEFALADAPIVTRAGARDSNDRTGGSSARLRDDRALPAAAPRAASATRAGEREPRVSRLDRMAPRLGRSSGRGAPELRPPSGSIERGRPEAVPAAPTAAVTVPNFSFESPTAPSSTVTGWTTNASAGVDPSSFGFTVFADGVQNLYLNLSNFGGPSSNSAVSNPGLIGAAQAGTYTLTVAGGHRFGANTTDGLYIIELLANGVPIASETVVDPQNTYAENSWNDIVAVAVVEPGDLAVGEDLTIRLTATDGTLKTQGQFDNVRLDYQEPPGTGACCLGNVCRILLSSECDSLDGEFQGNDSVCTPTTCGDPYIVGVNEAGQCVAGIPLTDVEPGEPIVVCEDGLPRIGKQVFTKATVFNADGSVSAQGPFAVVVPDPGTVIGDFLASPIQILIFDESGDYVIKPGETATLFATVLNVGYEQLTSVTAKLISPPNFINPWNVTFVAGICSGSQGPCQNSGDCPGAESCELGESTYATFPGLSDAELGDCENEPTLTFVTNDQPYEFTLDPGQAGNTMREFKLVFSGIGPDGPVEHQLKLPIGIGEACDPLGDTTTHPYDGLSGLNAPVGAVLAPREYPLNVSGASFSAGAVVPLEFDLLCGLDPADPNTYDFLPRIFGIVHETAGNLLGDLIPDRDDRFFTCSGSTCSFDLDTSAIPPGTIAIQIEMPGDARVFQAGVTLN